MNWNDPEQVSAYKAGYMRAFRLAPHVPNPCATDLANIVMMNEFRRYKRRPKSKANRIMSSGSLEWQALEKR
jgi:hypothetical protein